MWRAFALAAGSSIGDGLGSGQIDKGVAGRGGRVGGAGWRVWVARSGRGSRLGGGRREGRLGSEGESLL